MNNLEYFLQNSGLSEDLKSVFREAWEEKVTQVRRETEEKIRKEMGERYEIDKSRLIDSIENFLTESLQKEIVEINNAKKKLYEESRSIKENLLNEVKQGLDKIKIERDKIKERKTSIINNLKKMKKEMIENYHTKLNKFLEFADKKLNSEIKELRNDMKNIKEEKRKIQEDLRNSRLEYKRVYEERIKKIEKFLIKQLAEELAEFNKDKKLLESRRLELEVMASKKINEARKMFIEKATKLIENIVSEEMTKELKQLKEDICFAKQNDFGRRIFEAFVSEFMSSHLMENSEIANLKKKLEETNKYIDTLKSQLVENREALKQSKKDASLLKEEMLRMKTLSELLEPLSPKQRKLMSSLLEGVKTENLSTQFKKYLPSVIDETSFKQPTAKTIVNESLTDSVATVVTGDRTTKLEEKEELNTVIELKKLAGIK